MNGTTGCRIGATLAGLLLLLGAGNRAAALPLVDVTAGAKGGLGMALLLAEDKFRNEWARQLYEGNDGFGVGGGGGLFGEVRVAKLVGLELDLLYSKDQVKRTDKFVGTTFEVEHTTWANDLRVPVLLKGYLPLGLVRLSLGLGAEYVHPLDQGYDMTPNVSLDAQQQAVVDAATKGYKAVAKDSIFLTGQLELAIDLGLVQIPIDLRVGKNLSQSDTLEDRYDYKYTQRSVPGGTVYTVTGAEVEAIYSWDFRVLAGVAVSF